MPKKQKFASFPRKQNKRSDRLGSSSHLMQISEPWTRRQIPHLHPLTKATKSVTISIPKSFLILFWSDLIWVVYKWCLGFQLITPQISSIYFICFMFSVLILISFMMILDPLFFIVHCDDFDFFYDDFGSICCLYLLNVWIYELYLLCWMVNWICLI
jgi:hypothetical protein